MRNRSAGRFGRSARLVGVLVLSVALPIGCTGQDSDGAAETAATGNQPPTVQILSPEDLSSHSADLIDGRFGVRLMLEAEASDPDGDDVSVRWTSSEQGDLGEGSALDVVIHVSNEGLDASQPTITAIATDERGAEARASVSILVVIPSDS